MTGENRTLNAHDELARAATSLQEARALKDASLPFGAASRAYYAVFHAARALLFSLGPEPRTHRGTAALIGEHFGRPGRLAADLGRLLSRMQRDQEDADYLAGAVFTEAEAAAMIADAERFLGKARSLLEADNREATEWPGRIYWPSWRGSATAPGMSDRRQTLRR